MVASIMAAFLRRGYETTSAIWSRDLHVSPSVAADRGPQSRPIVRQPNSLPRSSGVRHDHSGRISGEAVADGHVEASTCRGRKGQSSLQEPEGTFYRFDPVTHTASSLMSAAGAPRSARTCP